MSDIRAIAFAGGAAVTQSDTTADTAGPFAGIEATAASGLAKVTTVDGSVITVYLTQGLIKPIEVTRVWSSVTAGGLSIVGYYSSGKVL